MLPQVKNLSTVFFPHQNCLELFSLANGTWSVHISLLIQIRLLFHCRKPYNKQRTWKVDTFFLETILISSQWWMCFFLKVIVILSSAVRTLILTAPIHHRGSIDNATFFQTCSNEEANFLSGWPEHFQKMFIFALTILWIVFELNCKKTQK